VAEQALSNAKRVREEGALEVALERLGALEREVAKLSDVASLPSSTESAQ